MQSQAESATLECPERGCGNFGFFHTIKDLKKCISCAIEKEMRNSAISEEKAREEVLCFLEVKYNIRNS